VDAIREAVGDEVHLALDCHWAFDVTSAVGLGRALEPYNLMWIEDPIPAGSPKALAKLRSEIAVPVCVGEVLETRYAFRELLELRSRIHYPSRVARIVANESLGPQRTLLVSLGSSDGITLDMPVLAPHGVVGRVIALAPHTAKVQLITDAGSGTAVTVARTRLQGLVSGRGGDTLLLRYIPKLEDVRPGDRLVTSCLDRIYPAGFPLGTVLRVAAGSGPMKEIEVFPAVDASRLEEVLLLEVEGRPLCPGSGRAGDGDGEASAEAEIP